MSDRDGSPVSHFLIRVIRWAVLLPLALAVLLFVIDNRQAVQVSFPLTGMYMRLPLFLILLLVFLSGLFIGALAAWLGSLKYRRRARHERKAREALAHDMEKVVARGSSKALTAERSPYLPDDDD